MILDLGTGVVDGSNLSKTESAMQAAAAGRGGSVTFTTVSGVGSHAVIFNFHVSGTTEDGILASDGLNYVTITVNPEATTAQLEALAIQLL